MHSKVKGTQLWPFDEDYISNTLGIVGANEHQKVRYELSLCQNKRLTEQSVIGWGVNNFSQLGLS
jgi:alpha-tubulin suppressor-like RCC1 family protein